MVSLDSAANFNLLSLAICAATVLIAAKLRAFPFAVLSLFFALLVPMQGLYLIDDLQEASSTTRLYTSISREGFGSASVYLLLTCSLVFLLLVLRPFSVQRRKQVIRDRAEPVCRLNVYRPSTSFTFGLYLFVLLVTLVLVFVVVGAEEFTSSSRPGAQSGATIFLVMLSVGVIPTVLRFLAGSLPKRSEILLFVLVLAVTAGFSRIHVLVYVFAATLSAFYGRRLFLRALSTRLVLGATALSSLVVSIFFIVGAVRDALNYVSFFEILAFLSADDSVSLLTLERTYRIGVEGMSGLAGAFTAASSQPALVDFDFGASWIMKGALQSVPGFIKAAIEPLYSVLRGLEWYSESVVPSGIEMSFTSFGWFGPFFYSAAFYFLFFLVPRALLRFNGCTLKRLLLVLFLSNGIFFVRGSWTVWIGYSLSYTVVLLMAWGIFKSRVRKEHFVLPTPLRSLKFVRRPGRVSLPSLVSRTASRTTLQQ